MNLFWGIAIVLAAVQLSGLCTTVYLHRYVTHRGLQMHPAVSFLMHFYLTAFTGVNPREWAAVHRKHHHFSDKEGDPHSPYVYGVWNVLFRNYFYYRRECSNPQTVEKYTPDYKPDILDRIGFARFGIVLGIGFFTLLFGWVWGPVAWAAHAVIYVLSNSTINSICHMFGYRNFDNLATNVKLVAWFTAGEGLHNNHHEFPSAARFAWKRHEFDPAWPVIRLLEKLKLARVNPLPIARAESQSAVA